MLADRGQINLGSDGWRTWGNWELIGTREVVDGQDKGRG